MLRTRVAIIVVGSALLAACAARAPNYTTSPSSTQALQSAKVQPVRVGEFTADPGAANKSIALRASTMEAPQGSYAAYLANAVKTELDLVKLYSATSGTEISGVLIKNEMNTGLAVTGNGTIQAKFVVRRDGMVRYDKTKLAQIEWDSNFIGAIAIPRAQQEYSRLVQKLVGEFFSDPDFVAALK